MSPNRRYVQFWESLQGEFLLTLTGEIPDDEFRQQIEQLMVSKDSPSVEQVVGELRSFKLAVDGLLARVDQAIEEGKL